MQSDLIIISEYCRKCGIEPSFISMLEEDGLIDVEERDNTKCFPMSQLADVERYARMYYDLSINIAGIDAIRHLLDRMESLQEEMRLLRNRLELYRERDYEDIDL